MFEVSMSRLSSYIELFIDEYDTSSAMAARYALNDWFKFIGGELSALTVTQWQIRDWVTQLRKRKGVVSRLDPRDTGLSWHTIKNRLGHVRRFYRSLVKAGILESSPFEAEEMYFKNKKSAEKMPHERIPDEKVKEILEANKAQTKEAQRNKALFTLLFATGCRKSEIYPLRLGDIRKTEKGTVYLSLMITKSHRAAAKTLPPWAHEAVFELKEQRERDGAKDEDRLFVLYCGVSKTPKNKICNRTLDRRFKEYCLLVGLPSNISPHCSRVTFASRELEKKSPAIVQKMLGHSSMKTTERYYRYQKYIDDAPELEVEEWGKK